MAKLSDLYPYTDSGLVGLRERSEIEGQFKVAQSTAYSEFIFVDGKLTSIDVWDTASKVTKLFTKTITYSGDDIDTVTLVDEVSGQTLTKTITFSLGNISTKTEVLS